MTDQQQELDLQELNEALKNLDQGDDDDPPKKDNKGEPEQNEGQTEQQHSNTEKDDKRKVDIETVYQLLNKVKNEETSSSGTKKQQRQKKPKTEKQQKQFEELQRKREQKREQERKEREKQKLLQEIDIDGLVNQKLQGILQQYEQQYQPSTVEPQAAPVDEKPAYPYNHLTTKPEKPTKPPSLFSQLGLNTSTPQKSRQPKQPATKDKPQNTVNPFDFFKKA